MSAMVDSAFTAMPRACRASRIAVSVIPGLLVAIARSVSACGSRMGRRWPPIFAGAVLPVWRTRCISLIAAEALTAKRRPACRIVLPSSTACTIRSRRPWDKGAVIINSTALTPRTWESDHLIPCKTEPLYPHRSGRIGSAIDTGEHRFGTVVEEHLNGFAIRPEMLTRLNTRIDEALVVVGLPQSDRKGRCRRP